MTYDEILEKAYYWDEDQDKSHYGLRVSKFEATTDFSMKKPCRVYIPPSLKKKAILLKNNIIKTNKKLKTPWISFEQYKKQCSQSVSRNKATNRAG